MTQVEIKEKIVEKRVQILQYLNTTILTFCLGFLMMLNTNISSTKLKQESQAQDLVKINTIQQINVDNVKSLDTRVKVLELNSQNELKAWVEANFTRKKE